MDDIPKSGFDLPGGSDLPVSEKRRQVLEALYEAATSGNVPAVLKWLELHRGQFDDPPAPTGEDPVLGASVVIDADAIQGVVEPEMLTALRSAVRLALEAHERNNRRGVAHALTEIEALVGGTDAVQRIESTAPRSQIHRELADLFDLPSKSNVQ